MYSSKQNVQILIALLKDHGVRHAVISPGSRNMAIVASLEHDPDFTCYSVVDERSAAYFAIGVSLAENAPVMLSCTSAQATRNYIPGMTEAYYRGVPLVVVTSDYKPSQIGQGLMQAMDQMSIPRDSAKASVSLPLVRDSDDSAYCARLVNETLLALNQHGTGPVHINIPVEEHWDGGVSELPPVRKIDRYTYLDKMPSLENRKIMIAVGQHRPFSRAEEDAIGNFALQHDAVVYTNHLSNYHGPNSVNASLLVTNVGQRKYSDFQPDLLITVGGQIGDYDFDALARKLPLEHWRVHPDGSVQDTYGKLTKVFELSETTFFTSFVGASSKAPEPSFASRWEVANAQRIIPAAFPLSHAYVAAQLAHRIPPRSIMHFAILSAFRNWSFFKLDPTIQCYSNVAAFGIDGCFSTFMGHAAATNELSFLVIGDLSFFYDMNAAGIRGTKNNVRVILVNNKGGGEFRLYENAADRNFGEQANLHIAAAGHHGSAKGWVESLGWGYKAVHSKDDLAGNSEWLLGDSDCPLLMEVFTTMQDDSDGVRTMKEANTIETLEQKIAKRLPPAVKRVAKTVLGR